mgnify:FL=1
MDFEFVGLNELIQKMEECADLSQQIAVDTKIINQAKSIVHETMKSMINRSKDHSKSGKKSSRPKHGHAADNIPISAIKSNGTYVYCDVGWHLSDNSEYFYMKFINWGTFRIMPADFTGKTKNKIESQLASIAQKEYQSFLNQKLG